MTTMMAITVAESVASSLGDGAVPEGDKVVVADEFVWLPRTVEVPRGAVEVPDTVLSCDGEVVVAGCEIIDAAENMDK